MMADENPTKRIYGDEVNWIMRGGLDLGGMDKVVKRVYRAKGLEFSGD